MSSSSSLRNERRAGGALAGRARGRSPDLQVFTGGKRKESSRKGSGECSESEVWAVVRIGTGGRRLTMLVGVRWFGTKLGADIMEGESPGMGAGERIRTVKSAILYQTVVVVCARRKDGGHTANLKPPPG